MSQQPVNIPSNPPRIGARARRTRGAFTLIELLVVIAMIALLVTILVPSLRKARGQAKDVLCAANLRAIGLGWHLYLQDSDNYFPSWRGNTQWFYGGRHPSVMNERAGGWALPYRPLNPYVAMDLRNERGTGLFQCPFDRTIIDTVRGGISHLDGFTAYEYYGNDYLLNWLLLRPFHAETAELVPGVKSFRLEYVQVEAARLVMAGDCQWYYTVNDAQWDANFHNYDEQMNLLFVDGHVSFLQLERGWGITGQYTFWPYTYIPLEEEDEPTDEG